MMIKPILQRALLIFISINFAVIFLGVVWTNVFMNDVSNISEQELKCAHQFYAQHANNPIANIICFETVIEQKIGDKFILGSYSIFSKNCGRVELICDEYVRRL